MLLAVLIAVGHAATPSTGATGDTGVLATGGTGAVVGTGDTGPTTTDPGLDLDGDGDGVTPREGDCDDADPTAAPGLPEDCADRADNDCNGLYNDGCDDSVHLASLRGGGGCTGGGGIAGTQTVVLVPLASLAWFRRRSASA